MRLKSDRLSIEVREAGSRSSSDPCSSGQPGTASIPARPREFVHEWHCRSEIQCGEVCRPVEQPAVLQANQVAKEKQAGNCREEWERGVARSFRGDTSGGAPE